MIFIKITNFVRKKNYIKKGIQINNNRVSYIIIRREIK